MDFTTSSANRWEIAMITDEQIDSLLTRLVRAGSNTEREIIESWIKPILAAEYQRGIEDGKRGFVIVNGVKRRIEALRQP